jgi:F0F1-type ATP synthase epsilon subunit
MAVRQDASTGKMVDDGKGKKEKSEELKDDKGQPMMRVKVYSPFKSYFDEPAYSISAENHTGPFDILPRHHNFMTLVSACEMRIVAPTGDKTIRINRAVMHVKADQIVVFLDV